VSSDIAKKKKKDSMRTEVFRLFSHAKHCGKELDSRFTFVSRVQNSMAVSTKQTTSYSLHSTRHGVALHHLTVQQ
jgi:hypothetical protein